MKKFFGIISCFIVFGCSGGASRKSADTDELIECYPNGTCDIGHECNTNLNLCEEVGANDGGTTSVSSSNSGSNGGSGNVVSNGGGVGTNTDTFTNTTGVVGVDCAKNEMPESNALYFNSLFFNGDYFKYINNDASPMIVYADNKEYNTILTPSSKNYINMKTPATSVSKAVDLLAIESAIIVTNKKSGVCCENSIEIVILGENMKISVPSANDKCFRNKD